MGRRWLRTMLGVLAEFLSDAASSATGPVGAADVAGCRSSPDPASVLDHAHRLMDEAAGSAVQMAAWSSDEPLRLWKHRLTWLLRCPKRAMAADSLPSANTGDLVIGLIVDAAAKLLALGARRPVTVEAAIAFLEAQGDERARQHLSDIGEAAAAELVAEAAPRLDRLSNLWPDPEPAWWPRVEEPVRVSLAKGAVVLSARLDILLGGTPTGRPSVPVEIKGGRWHDSVRSDAHFYGLLLGLRDGAAPEAVVSIAAHDGTTQIEPIRPAVLRHTAERVAVALDVAARLAIGEAPDARPGSHCITCPLRSTCSAALEANVLGPHEPGDQDQAA